MVDESVDELIRQATGFAVAICEARYAPAPRLPPSAKVHSYKKVIYDRVNDADVKVTATSQIATMYIRKQNVFTEKKIYPYLKKEELRLDLLLRIRQMAVNHAMGAHPWKEMDDDTLLRSAREYGAESEKSDYCGIFP